jgi:hypothetical protein
MIKKTCQICGKKFIMGETGTIFGCDVCTGVERDQYGYAWERGIKRQTYQNIATGKIFIRERPKHLKEGAIGGGG